MPPARRTKSAPINSNNRLKIKPTIRPKIRRAYTIDKEEASRIKALLESKIKAGKKPFYRILNMVVGEQGMSPDLYSEYIDALIKEVTRLDKKVKSGPVDLKTKLLKQIDLTNKAVAAVAAKGAINTLAISVAATVAAKYGLGAGLVKGVKVAAPAIVKSAVKIMDMSDYYKIYTDVLKGITHYGPFLSEVSAAAIFLFHIARYLPAAAHISESSAKKMIKHLVDLYSRSTTSVAPDKFKNDLIEAKREFSKLGINILESAKNKYTVSVQCDIINAIYASLSEKSLATYVHTHGEEALSLYIANSISSKFSLRNVASDSKVGKLSNTVIGLSNNIASRMAHIYSAMRTLYGEKGLTPEVLNRLRLTEFSERRRQQNTQIPVLITEQAKELMEIIFGTTDYVELMSYFKKLDNDCLEKLVTIIGFNHRELKIDKNKPPDQLRLDYMTYLQVVIEQPSSDIQLTRDDSPGTTAAPRDYSPGTMAAPRDYSPGTTASRRRRSENSSTSRNGSDRSSRDSSPGNSGGGTSSRRRTSRKPRKTIRKKVSKSMKRTFKKTRRQRR